MINKHQIKFILNGDPCETEVETTETLLELLRNKFGIKSPKIACERGDCGACTILFDGKTVRSCLMLAVEVDGHEVTTIEGLSKKELTPLQKAFAEKNAFQCGFCAPGVILSATELLQKHSHPSAAEVKEAIAGNLCRCTGYQPIIDTIIEVSQKGHKHD